MKVCSFNIWSDRPRNARWQRRREPIAGVLRQCEIDLAGLQEATAPMVRDLHERLPGYAWIGVGRDDGREAGEMTPIFFHADRMTLLEHAHFWLAAEGDRPRRGWDAACVRIVTWARFAVNATGRQFVHFNTHLDHLGRNARLQSARLLRRKAVEIAAGDPVVMTGDFNCSESSAPYRTITGRLAFSGDADRAGALRDTFYDCEAAPLGPRRTFLGLLGRFGLRRIDYIFVSRGLRTRRHAVLEDTHRASDHRPVLAELDFADEAGPG